MDHFPFRFDDRYRALLRPLGVTDDRAEVRVGDGRLEARFGRWQVRTDLTNVRAASVTGPHRRWKAIGLRLSLADRGLTFGTNAERTVCIDFREPVRGVFPGGVVRHPNLTVSVADPDALVARLRAATSDG